MQGSWYVQYTDGGSLAQYDSKSPHFDPAGGEVPYRAIDWPRVERVKFESQWVETDVSIGTVPEGYQLSLRSRHFVSPAGDTSHCYIILTSKAGAEVDATSVVHAYYWFPDGSEHQCEQFDCPDVRKYGAATVHGLAGELMPLTETKQVYPEVTTTTEQ